MLLWIEVIKREIGDIFLALRMAKEISAAEPDFFLLLFFNYKLSVGGEAA